MAGVCGGFKLGLSIAGSDIYGAILFINPDNVG